MHILLGLLGAMVTVLYLLDRLGIDIGGLNPFYWYRRRAFVKKYGADPIYSIEDPVHVASLLVIGAAKLDGDLTAAQKALAREQFESTFSMSSREASDLFGSAAHLLAAPQLLEGQLTKLVDKTGGMFSKEQVESLVDMMVKVASADGEMSPKQKEFIGSIGSRFVREEQRQGTWA